MRSSIGGEPKRRSSSLTLTICHCWHVCATGHTDAVNHGKLAEMTRVRTGCLGQTERPPVAYGIPAADKFATEDCEISTAVISCWDGRQLTVVENSTKVLPVWEHVGLMRQSCTTGFDCKQTDTDQLLQKRGSRANCILPRYTQGRRFSLAIVWARRCFLTVTGW